MRHRFLFLIIVFIIFFPNQILFGKAPIKFGKVSMEELKMTSYDKDTSAPAVILCDYGYFSASDFTYTRILRIKILKKEGYDYANQVFPAEFKSNVKGRTTNLINGEIVQEKLQRDNIFIENVTKDFTITNVAMPAVQVGSVIDIEVFMEGIPDVWYFQSDIPVVYSSLTMEQSEYVDYRRNYFGDIILIKNTDTEWEAKDVPAFHSEPYSNSKKNYLARMEFELLRIAVPGVFYREYSTDWNSVVDRLQANDYFAGVLQTTLFLRSVAKEIQEANTDPMEQLKAAYENIKQVKWNERKSLYASWTSLSKPYKEKLGNSADINMLLYKLLNMIDIPAYLVVLSTRDNGVIPPYRPSLRGLNYVIVKAKIDDENFLLDATDEYLPVGLLPERCLNWFGRQIQNERTEQISLTADKEHKKRIYTQLTLKEDQSLKGILSETYYDYAAYDFRRTFREYVDEEEYLQDFEEENDGFYILENEISNLESIYDPVKIDSEVEIKSKTEKVGDKTYIYPLVYGVIDENPFVNPSRRYPVDFIYPRTIDYTLKLDLPEGTSVESLPQKIKIVLPDDGGLLLYNYALQGNSLQLVFKFKLNKSLFQPTEYANLKEFIDLAVKKQQEPIVLKLN